MFFLEKIKFFLVKHVVIVVCAVGVGAISVAPYLLAQHALGNDYQGVHFVFMDDEPGYMARVREVLEGHGWLGSPFLYEYKNVEPIIPPLGEYWYAVLNILTHTSLSTTLLLAKFFFPSLLFVLIYFFVSQFNERTSDSAGRLTPLFAAFLVTLGYDLVDVGFIFRWIQGQAPGFHGLVWTRAVNPVTGAILMFIFLLLLKKIWDKKGSAPWYFTIASGIVVTLSIGYFFTWGILLSFLAVVCVAALVKRQNRLAFQLGLVAGVSFLTSLPILMRIFSSVGSPEGALLSARNGLYYTHTPIVNKLVLATTVVFIIVSFIQYYYKGQKNLIREDSWVWSLCSIIVSWMVFNQQIVTGRVVWHPHFVQYTIPLSMIVAALLFERLLRQSFVRIWCIISILGITCSIVYGVAASTTYRSKLAEFKDLQKYHFVFDWLNREAPADCVIFPLQPEKRYSLMLRAFTKCNLYVANTERFYAVPDGRQKHNFFLGMRLRGVGPDAIESYLASHNPEIINYFFENWDELFSSQLSSRLLKIREKLPDEYKAFLKEDINQQLYQYKVNYLVSDAAVSPTVQKSLPRLKLIGDFGALYLYQL